MKESWSKISREERLSDQSDQPYLLTDESDIEKQYNEQQEYSVEQKSSALCEYEKILHTDVFLPAWKLMKVNIHRSICYIKFVLQLLLVLHWIDK